MQTYVFFGLRDGLHQVHPLSVDLDQRQDVPVPDGLVQSLHSGGGVSAEVLNKTLLRVLGCDVVFPRLPGDDQSGDGRSQQQSFIFTFIISFTYFSKTLKMHQTKKTFEVSLLVLL